MSSYMGFKTGIQPIDEGVFGWYFSIDVIGSLISDSTEASGSGP